MKIKLPVLRDVVLLVLGFYLSLSAMAAPTQLVTTIDPAVGPPASGGGNSMNPAITPDGRYVLFASTAGNLALTTNHTPFPPQTFPRMNVFLRDRAPQTTILVSANLNGTGGGNGDSLPVDISTNGQFALFESTASDLVPGDTNNANDVFVRDIVNGTNILVSIAGDGGFANGASWGSAMTPDGRYVAFASAASNLVAGDTNGISDIFIRDLQLGVTTLASPGALPGPVASRSDSPQLTPDGQFAAFLSTATNVVAGVSTMGEVYVSQGGLSTFLASGNAHVVNHSTTAISYNQAISDNGQYIAFETSSNGSTASGIIQRFNQISGLTDIVATNAIGPIAGYPAFRDLDMTSDGRVIAFVVSLTNNSGPAVFLWDAQTATATLVSCNTNNLVPTNTVSDWPAVDATGRYVVFHSTATTLTTNLIVATNAVTGEFHLYLRDLQLGTTTLIDADTNGFGAAKAFMNPARITPDGRFIAFDCTDGNLAPGDNNRAFDVFVREVTASTNELISVRQEVLPSQNPPGPGPELVFSVDTAGRYIAFASAAGSLVPNSTNASRNVFVHDLLNGTNGMASVFPNGLANAAVSSAEPDISGDGRYVVFTSISNASTSTANIDGQNVYLRDLQAGTTTPVSMNASRTGPGNRDSYSPVISQDDRHVLFSSRAGDLANPAITAGTQNLFVRDLTTGTNYCLTTSGVSCGSMTPDGHFVAYSPSAGNLYVWDTQMPGNVYTNLAGTISSLAISPDGNRIAYCTSGGFYAADRSARINWLIGLPLSGLHSNPQFSGDARLLVYSTTSPLSASDTNGVADVYLYDLQTRSNLLVSCSPISAAAANGPSDSPVISPDGRFIAYRSSATDLSPGATNGLPNLFLYDRMTGTTALLTVNTSGSVAGNNRSFAPAFSGDSHTVVFHSWSSDLVAGDYNGANDLFAVEIATANPAPVFAGQIVFAPVSGQSPTLTWPATAGKTYQVQFKNNLSDAAWQPLNGNVWVDGDRGYATDLAPNASQRFYQVVAF